MYMRWQLTLNLTRQRSRRVLITTGKETAEWIRGVWFHLALVQSENCSMLNVKKISLGTEDVLKSAVNIV